MVGQRFGTTVTATGLAVGRVYRVLWFVQRSSVKAAVGRGSQA